MKAFIGRFTWSEVFDIIAVMMTGSRLYQFYKVYGFFFWKAFQNTFTSDGTGRCSHDHKKLTNWPCVKLEPFIAE